MIQNTILKFKALQRKQECSKEKGNQAGWEIVEKIREMGEDRRWRDKI